MVGGGVQPGVRDVVRSVPGRTGESAAAVKGAVCGFCVVAEELAGRRSAGGRIGLLEAATGGDTGAVGVDDGPAKAGGADVCRRGLLPAVDGGADGGVEEGSAGESGDVVHDAAGGVGG